MSIGKTTLSNAFTDIIPPRQGSLKEESCKQFQYTSDNNLHVERIDAFISGDLDKELTTSKSKNKLYLIEHPEQKGDLKCDVIVALGVPSLTSVEEKIMNVNGRSNHSLAIPQRHIQIAFNHEYFNEDTFQKTLTEMKPYKP